MSLATLMTALVEYAADVIQNDCDRPAPDRVLRYHNDLPHFCCTDNGVVSISWANLYGSQSFPANNQGDPCGAMLVTTIALKYLWCYPVVDRRSWATDENFALFDERAAVLADVAECVTRGLLTLSCDPDLGDPYVAAVVAAAGQKRVRLIEAAPLAVLGGCTGVRWRLYAGVREPPVFDVS